MKKHYQVIPRNLCFIFRNNKVLLQKGSPNKKHWANTLNALGGHIEKGEELNFAASREINEESGLTIEPESLKLKGLIHVRTYFEEDVIMFIYMGIYKKGIVKNSNEGTLDWIEINKIKKMENIAEDLKTIIPLLTSLKNGEIISGTSKYNKKRKLINLKLNVFNT